MTMMELPGHNQQFVLEIDTCPIYECLLLLDLLGDSYYSGDKYEVGKGWFETLRAKVSPELTTAMKDFNMLEYTALGGHKLWTNLTGLAYTCPAPRDIPAFIAQIEALSPTEVRLFLLGYYLRRVRRIVAPDLIFRAADGDQQAQEQLCTPRVVDNSTWWEVFRFTFSMSALELQRRVVTILARWYEEVFRDLEGHIVPVLLRDAEKKRNLQTTLPSDRLIEQATNGLEFFAEPGYRVVRLIPGFTQRPWVLITEYLDTKIFYYPIADESLSENYRVPPTRLVRLYKALADERRLRALQFLSLGNKFSLQEIANEVGVTKPTAHHHLAILRTAGLVRVDADEKLYSLRKEELPAVLELLQHYLQQAQS